MVGCDAPRLFVNRGMATHVCMLVQFTFWRLLDLHPLSLRPFRAALICQECSYADWTP